MKVYYDSRSYKGKYPDMKLIEYVWTWSSILDENGELIDRGKIIYIGITINTVDKDVKVEK